MPRADKFERTMYVTAFELARDGLSDNQVAKALGVAWLTLARWCKRDPALTDALARGRHHRDPQDEFKFHDYVYDRLAPKLKETWDKIEECEKLDNGVERIEALLGHAGVRARQHLFVYSLTQSQFNVSKSLRKLNITRHVYDNWCANDPDFAALVDEIHFHKKNFYENAFNRQVKQGQILAVLHAVKTQCRDRGFGDKIEVKHTGTVTHQHTVNITDLQLPLELRQAVLQALRRHTEANGHLAPPGVTVAPGVPLLAHAAGTEADE